MPGLGVPGRRSARPVPGTANGNLPLFIPEHDDPNLFTG